MSKVHSFCIKEAQEKGVYKAIVLFNIRYWLEYNLANKKNIHDGYVWTYNSASAFTKFFPYFNERKIHRILSELVKDKHLLTGNYNKAGYDRTKWYTMEEYAIGHKVEECEQVLTLEPANEAIHQKCPMHLPILSNASTNFVGPIPDINQIENTDINKENNNKEISIVLSLDEIVSSDQLTKENLDSMKDDVYFEGLWLAKPRRGKNPHTDNTKETARKALTKRLKENHCRLEIVNGLLAYRAFCEAKGWIGQSCIKMLSTFLGPDLHFQSDWTISDQPAQQQTGYAPVITEKKKVAAAIGNIHDYDW